MRTETVTIDYYKFNELSDDAKERALVHCYDWNVSDAYWHESIIDEASELGIKIEGFDHRGTIEGTTTINHIDICNAIMEKHGVECDTYITAEEYLRETLNKSNDIDDLNREFKTDILNNYLSILNSQYEYLTSNEAIQESIESNEVEFSKDGKVL